MRPRKLRLIHIIDDAVQIEWYIANWAVPRIINNPKTADLHSVGNKISNKRRGYKKRILSGFEQSRIDPMLTPSLFTFSQTFRVLVSDGRVSATRSAYFAYSVVANSNASPVAVGGITGLMQLAIHLLMQSNPISVPEEGRDYSHGVTAS